jgi:hypothetical protein
VRALSAREEATVQLSVVKGSSTTVRHMMALSQHDLLRLLESLRSGDGLELVRSIAERMFQELIEAEAAAVIGAGWNEHTDTRTGYRNGHRDKTLTTQAGDLDLAIPKLRAGTFFPSLLERRRRIDQALFAVIMEVYVHGVSSRSVDDLAQAALTEQRNYLHRGGPRRKAPGNHGRSLLTAADKVAITVVYLRGVCPQKALVDLLAINDVTVGQAIRETRGLIEEQKIRIPQTPHYFSHARDLQDWYEHGAVTDRMQISRTLGHPDLTGMPRDDLQALIDRITVPYRAAVERRRRTQRGGDRKPGTRGGVFRQKITDADRVLATVLAARKLCSPGTLADLFGVSRGTIHNAIDDVLPLLHEHGRVPVPSDHRFADAAGILEYVATAHDPESPR